MSLNNIVIREPDMDDLAAITLLINQLGYPTNAVEMETRLQAIGQKSDYKTIVATLNNEVVGLLGLFKGHYYELNGIICE